MRKVLYTKFSRERRNEFQIMTRITEEDGIRRVWKLPLQKEGELHIRHMYENYRKLEHLYTYAGVQICPCELDEEKCALAFPFVEGESLETRISRHGKEKDFASLKKDYELLYQIIASAKGKKSFVETDAFCEVFGHPALKEGLAAAEISNIDMIPGNLLLDGEKVWVADYEWVFPFAVPIAFIYARSVFLQEAARRRKSRKNCTPLAVFPWKRFRYTTIWKSASRNSRPERVSQMRSPRSMENCTGTIIRFLSGKKKK